MEEKEFIFNEESKEIGFKIYNDPYGEGKPLFAFPNETLTIKPGVTCLVGCNGYGKSTIINRISEIHTMNKDDFELVQFNDREDGGQSLIEKATMYGDFRTVATMVQSSEGERIVIYFGTALTELRQKILNNKKKAFVITIDSIDSGLSIDNIDLIKNLICEHIAKEAPNVYILISVISYEFTKNMRCVDTHTGCEVRFLMWYDSYAEYIRETAEIKRKRFEE